MGVKIARRRTAKVRKLHAEGLSYCLIARNVGLSAKGPH
jgi:hypothetical protein